VQQLELKEKVNAGRIWKEFARNANFRTRRSLNSAVNVAAI